MPGQIGKKSAAPHEYELISIDPKDVGFNRKNPRGETAEEIRSDPEFSQLVDSVHEFGVLVPIVVHHQEKGTKGKPYRLVDGERRLRAALKTNRSTVPAHVAKGEPSMHELVQAFHIHMLRKQWGHTAQTRALKLIIKELKQKNPALRDKELFSKLQGLTGYTKTQLGDLLHATEYDDSVLEDVDKKTLAWSYLVQFEESFLEPLRQHYPSLFRKYGAQNLRSILIRKAKRKVLSGTRALMLNIVPVVSRAQNQAEKEYVEGLLGDFVKDEDLPAEEVRKRFERKFPESQTGLLNLLDQAIESADSLEHLLRALPGSQSMLSFPAKTKELYGKLESLKMVMAEKRSLYRSIRE
jgi:ParB/RepB/Spo0J family partition protein